MFNEDQKRSYIISLGKSPTAAKISALIFNRSEPYERKLGKDICEWSSAEMSESLGSMIGLSHNSSLEYISLLKRYMKWCADNNIKTTGENAVSSADINLDKIRSQMVSGPMQLQNCLDSIFDRESDESIDVVYRCYFWMAFCGIKEPDTVLIKKSDVNIQRLQIIHNGRVIPVYREAIPAFEIAVNNNSFNYYHPKYSSVVSRCRVAGDILLRGVKANPDSGYIRRKTVQKIREATNGAGMSQLSFRRLSMSGLFYRAFERERAGIPVSFESELNLIMDGKQYKTTEYSSYKIQRQRLERSIRKDYERWKMAFSV